MDEWITSYHTTHYYLPPHIFQRVFNLFICIDYDCASAYRTQLILPDSSMMMMTTQLVVCLDSRGRQRNRSKLITHLLMEKKETHVIYNHSFCHTLKDRCFAGPVVSVTIC